MIINLEFDAQAQAAPQSFRDAVQTAADILGQMLTDSITVNIAVGYDEITNPNSAPHALPAGKSAASVTAWEPTPYGALAFNLMERMVDPDMVGALAGLPPGPSFDGQTFIAISGAESKALGGRPATYSALDGTVGFSATTPIADMVSAALHELSHALGRSGDLADVFDFWRYSAPGTPLLTTGSTAVAAYFSLDGGVTPLADYGQDSDPSDFITHDP